MNDKFKIDFIGIGAPRCATSWVAQCLMEHPQVCFSSKKELNYFDKEYKYEERLKGYQVYFKDCQRIFYNFYLQNLN